MDTAAYSGDSICFYAGINRKRFNEICKDLDLEPNAEYSKAEYYAIMRSAEWTITDEGWTK